MFPIFFSILNCLFAMDLNPVIVSQKYTRVSHKYPKSIPKVAHGYLKSIPKVALKYLNSIPIVSQKYFKSIPKVWDNASNAKCVQTFSAE